MSELPTGWGVIPLGTLLRAIEAGQNVKCEERPPTAGEVGLVKISAVTWGRFNEEASKTLPKDTLLNERNRIRSGDLLISRANTIELVGASVIVGLIEKRLYLSDKVLRLVVDEPVKRWINYALKTPQLRQAIQAASTGNQLSMRNIPQEKLRSLSIPLAPAAEQTRIADQLDTLLARIQACSDRLNAIPALLKRFRQAALNAATSGMLTEEWRSEQVGLPSASELRHAVEADHLAVGGHARGNASAPTEEAHDLSIDQIPEGWDISTLQDCCVPGRPITYGILKPGPELDEGVPYIRVADFPGNRLHLNSIKKTTPEIDLQYKRARLVSGDLLLSIRGSVGRLIVIPPSLEGANITQDTARLSITHRLNGRYVYYALLSPDAQRRMAKAIRGVAVRGINIGDVRALQLPLPSLPEQTEIVRQLDALFLLANQIEARWDAMRTNAQRLVPQLLSKAFRGELVKQDPQDEPASVLLRRLTEKPTTAATTLRGRPRHKQLNTPTASPTVQQDWAALPAGTWAASGQPDEHATTAQLIAVLKAWGQPMPQDQARLAAVLCLQPRLFTAALPSQDAAQWRRLVGAEAEPLPASVAALQPAVNTHWRRALAGLRARGDLVVSRASPQDTWALGPGANRVDTTGWPDGRAGWVAAYLRAHGVEALLPLLSPAAVDFVHARAA
jgi:type I restriction enzyme S subunit